MNSPLSSQTNLTKKPIKVSIIGTRGYPYVYGGFETFVKEISERLAQKEEVEIHVYCQKNLFKEYPKQVNGVFLHYLPTLPHKSLNQLVHCFLSIVHASFSGRKVLLVLNLAAGPMGWIPKLLGKKTVINTDGLEWLRPKWKGLGAAYFRFGARCATWFYDRIVTDAEAMRQVYLTEFKRDSTVIAYGAPEFEAKPASMLAEFNLRPQEYYLIVGRLIPDNNADLLIKGFLEAGSQKKLLVVGDVPYSDAYASGLKDLQNDKLVFAGYVRNQDTLMALYQHCFAYLHGHKFGGTNPAMLKAMTNKCAILALDTVFNREMLSNGKFGLFFEEKSTAVAEKMRAIEAAPERVHALRASVQQGLTDKYNWNQVSEKYLQVFKELHAD